MVKHTADIFDNLGLFTSVVRHQLSTSITPRDFGQQCLWACPLGDGQLKILFAERPTLLDLENFLLWLSLSFDGPF